jgi:hypothetical protein
MSDTCSLFILPQGFDEFMNIVIDEAAEIYVKDAKPRRELGAFRPLPHLPLRSDTFASF